MQKAYDKKNKKTKNVQYYCSLCKTMNLVLSQNKHFNEVAKTYDNSNFQVQESVMG